MPKQTQPLTRERLEGFGSLIIVRKTNHCLGDLAYFDQLPDGKGVFHKNLCFCPTYGQVPVSKAEAEAHNAALDKALIEGLTTTCQVGQGAGFYLNADWTIRTFSGTRVAVASRVVGRCVVFSAGGRKFRGWRHKNDDWIFFKRIA